MANFMGGSAPAMANQVAEGFILMSVNSLRSLSAGDLQVLKFELEKLQREARAEVPSAEDASANQARNRKITRINSALQVIQNKLSQRH
jgi:hypothetical protein